MPKQRAAMQATRPLRETGNRFCLGMTAPLQGSIGSIWAGSNRSGGRPTSQSRRQQLRMIQTGSARYTRHDARHWRWVLQECEARRLPCPSFARSPNFGHVGATSMRRFLRSWSSSSISHCLADRPAVGIWCKFAWNWGAGDKEPSRQELAGWPSAWPGSILVRRWSMIWTGAGRRMFVPIWPRRGNPLPALSSRVRPKHLDACRDLCHRLEVNCSGYKWRPGN